MPLKKRAKRAGVVRGGGRRQVGISTRSTDSDTFGLAQRTVEAINQATSRAGLQSLRRTGLLYVRAHVCVCVCRIHQLTTGCLILVVKKWGYLNASQCNGKSELLLFWGSKNDSNEQSTSFF